MAFGEGWGAAMSGNLVRLSDHPARRRGDHPDPRAVFERSREALLGHIDRMLAECRALRRDGDAGPLIAVERSLRTLVRVTRNLTPSDPHTPAYCDELARIVAELGALMVAHARHHARFSTG